MVYFLKFYFEREIGGLCVQSGRYGRNSDSGYATMPVWFAIQMYCVRLTDGDSRVWPSRYGLISNTWRSATLVWCTIQASRTLSTVQRIGRCGLVATVASPTRDSQPG